MGNGERGDSAPHAFAHSSAHTTTKPIATNTNLAASADYHQQSFYEYLLQHE